MKTLPKQSLAAVVEEFGAPVVLEEVPVPQTLEPGALLVEVEACTVCGTDTHLWRGELAVNVDLPVILGHEMVGRIVAMGPGSEKDSTDTDLRVGDRVVWAHSNCSRCRYCNVGLHTFCPNRRMYMYETCADFPYLLGGFSQYAYVLASSGRVKVPDSVSDALASLSSCALRSVVNAFNQVGSVSVHDSVLIQGTGPLGLLGVAMCHIAGVRQIIVIGAPEDRLDLALKFGADEVLAVDKTDAHERSERILDLTEGLGLEIGFEFSGNPHAFKEGVGLIAPGGRYMVVGQLGPDEIPFSPSIITKRNLSLLGSFSGGISHYWQALRFLERHQRSLPFNQLVTGQFALEDVNVALTRMKNQEEIKPMLLPPK